jgi:hypothetical protein
LKRIVWYSCYFSELGSQKFPVFQRLGTSSRFLNFVWKYLLKFEITGPASTGISFGDLTDLYVNDLNVNLLQARVSVKLTLVPQNEPLYIMFRCL